MALPIVTVTTTPFNDQAPGTSGLRKPTKVFMGENYTENFVQCTLAALDDKLVGSTLVVGGDGRYYGKEATEKIVQMCAANGVYIQSGPKKPKKRGTLLLSMSSPIIDRFSKFFHIIAN